VSYCALIQAFASTGDAALTRISSIRLGELEKAVLEHLWSVEAADAKAVHSIIGTQRGITLNTIQSTLRYHHQVCKNEKAVYPQG
jgi:hypothetical protein